MHMLFSYRIRIAENTCCTDLASLLDVLHLGIGCMIFFSFRLHSILKQHIVAVSFLLSVLYLFKDICHLGIYSLPICIHNVVIPSLVKIVERSVAYLLSILDQQFRR